MYVDNAAQTIKIFKNSKLSTTYSSFSLIWSSGIDSENETEVLRFTRDINGIISARYTCKAPYIMLVNYDPKLNTPDRIQQNYLQVMDAAAIKFTLRQ